MSLEDGRPLLGREANARNRRRTVSIVVATVMCALAFIAVANMVGGFQRATSTVLIVKTTEVIKIRREHAHFPSSHESVRGSMKADKDKLLDVKLIMKCYILPCRERVCVYLTVTTTCTFQHTSACSDRMNMVV
jgi:hypothetical protein